jgi:hypothetical protein
MRLLFPAAIVLAMISGCSTYSSNMRIGNDMAYVSLSDQRQASQLVKVYELTPAGAEALGTVDAGRCHRSFVETPPTEAMVLMDLKIAAFARGADGITDVSIRKESGFTKNCWYMLDGQATAVRLRDVAQR